MIDLNRWSDYIFNPEDERILRMLKNSKLQRFSETKWDSFGFTATVQNLYRNGFNEIPGTIGLRNYYQPNRLVGPGQYFVMNEIGVLVDQSSTAPTATGVATLIDRTRLDIFKNDKKIGTYPVHQLACGGGAFIPSQAAVTPAAAPAGACSNFQISNGVPIAGMFQVYPIIWTPEDKISLQWWTLVSGTLTNCRIMIKLNGIQFQPEQ